jgi:hypothetical protein
MHGGAVALDVGGSTFVEKVVAAIRVIHFMVRTAPMEAYPIREHIRRADGDIADRPRPIHNRARRPRINREWIEVEPVLNPFAVLRAPRPDLPGRDAGP